MESIRKGEPATPCIHVCKSKIQYDGSLDRLKYYAKIEGAHRYYLLGQAIIKSDNQFEVFSYSI